MKLALEAPESPAREDADDHAVDATSIGTQADPVPEADPVYPNRGETEATTYPPLPSHGPLASALSRVRPDQIVDCWMEAVDRAPNAPCGNPSVTVAHVSAIVDWWLASNGKTQPGSPESQSEKGEQDSRVGVPDDEVTPEGASLEENIYADSGESRDAPDVVADCFASRVEALEYLPSLGEIRRHCRKFQAMWSPRDERQRRTGESRFVPFEAAVVSAKSLSGGPDD